MTPRFPWTACAAAGLALAVPGAAQAATKTVYMGPPPTTTKAQQKVFERTSSEATDFFPHSVRIRAGDTVSFAAAGFHTVDMPRRGGKPIDFLTPAGMASGALDAAGAPFWFNGQVPTLGFNPRLLRSNFGKTKIASATTSVLSGLPLGDGPPKPMKVRFPKAGIYRYYCDIHPGMAGSVRVLPRSKRAPSKAADASGLARQVAAAVANAKKFSSSGGQPANTVSIGQQKGTVHQLGFAPSKLTVSPGTTVQFRAPSNSRDVHTVSFGPGNPNKDQKNPANYLAKLASTFEGPGPFDPIATWASEAPTAPPAALSPALHGNGFWNTGVTGGSGPLPRGGKVTFTTAGTYTFYCLIHPFMTGSITVK